MSRNSIRKNCCTDVLTHLRRLRFTEAELEQRDKSRKIDKFLEKDKNSFRRQVSNFLSLLITDDSLFCFTFLLSSRNWVHQSYVARDSIVYCLHISENTAFFVTCFAIFLGETVIVGRWRVGKVNISKANANHSWNLLWTGADARVSSRHTPEHC